jgi:hypothetical protein
MGYSHGSHVDLPTCRCDRWRVCHHCPVRRPTYQIATLMAAVLAMAGCSADEDAAPGPEPLAQAAPTTESIQATAPPVVEPTATPEPTASPLVLTPTPDATAPSPSTPPAPAAPTPTPTPGTVDADPTPIANPGETCTAGLAGDPTVTATERADFDGDGALDQVTTYRVGDSPGTWHIRVDTAAGESLDTPLGAIASPDANVIPLGGADVDGDGATEELFTVVGSGASVAIVAIHERSGCEIVSAEIGGAPVTFPVGGSIANIAGVQCVDTDNNGANNTIVAWTGLADFSQPEGTYDVEGVEYQLRSGELQEVGTRTIVANIAEADFVYGQLTCGALNL